MKRIAVEFKPGRFRHCNGKGYLAKCQISAIANDVVVSVVVDGDRADDDNDADNTDNDDDDDDNVDDFDHVKSDDNKNGDYCCDFFSRHRAEKNGFSHMQVNISWN